MGSIVNRGQVYLILVFFLAVVLITLLLPDYIRSVTGSPDVQSGSGFVFFTPTAPLEGQAATITDTPANLTPGNGGPPDPAAASSTNCTLEAAFWASHPESWPVEGFSIGSLSLTKQEALALLADTNASDVRITLLQQLIAYSLNSFRGADPAAILPTVAQVRTWIDQHLEDNPLSDQDRAQGLALAQALTEYNAGLSGPGQCTEDSVAPTATQTQEATPTPSPTPSDTPTLAATSTSPPPVILPSATATRRPRPRRTSPPPTKPPPPPPTQPPPPPTPVPTKVPTPTSPPSP